MRRLTSTEVHAQKVAELGLDSTVLDLTSIEAIAAALRRAASFLCPCTAATLVRNVVRPLRGLVDDLESMKDQIDETLEAMIAHGDLLEHRQVDEDHELGTGTLLYAAPPSFVARRSGAVILLGVAADQLSALPDELGARIEYVTHVRRLCPLPGEDLRDDLVQLGLIELSYDSWLKAPLAETPAQHVSRLDGLLDAAQPSRDIPGLSLLDTDRSVRYYRGRWVEPRTQSGRFVARRSQAYGANLWCYVQVRDGCPERLIDLPTSLGRWRGCDEAWHLQMAIDAHYGKPQRFRVRPGPAGSRLLELFSPVPMWARRRWDAVGEPTPCYGCLFAYRLAPTELGEELRFARQALWLDELTGSAKSQ
jgi:hypothetical protein